MSSCVSAPLSECDVVFLLMKEGFSERCAREIANIYKHIRDFKRPRDAAEKYERYLVRKNTQATT
jgi:hypothetical protein